ncbi:MULTISPECIES: ribonuclease E inhibitor RraB [Photobacterium]|uniref:Regulator of ribonuclease activity B n=1 Tax=Photobacterium toruni TaxID=1935446 RepID=A0ABU6LBQ3_9GAMM|nr:MULTISPECIES: ribonuclease E inhibitor RraB [Photobacterium]MEC6798424.1 ribonuclease E inhibitor RraB [Photobacterium sp. S4TG1]MEC6816409.1 ribonuclease E inhibitor RraB [Photobacterium toruni]MEC6833064.1 ribonuclease E inhibitor RraB [Photobacterium toruni]MEC6883616.1 ribonuclease E inhibitor RraB [Photobacterium piscicola]MEC6908575.1 ribonuclease E inhibitor RraB [Photobacterium piscicola]
MSYAELIAEQKEETREIIAALLEDGSEPEALYTIEHHFSADTFEELEAAAVEAFKLGFNVLEAEELELDPEDGGGKVVCFDAVMESALNAELIDEQAEKLIKLAEKHSIDYDGWGTYFESDEDDEEESEDEE